MGDQREFRQAPDAEDATAPIVIVGAGPVGLTLGVTLANLGIESLVLEKNEALEPYSRAILVPPRTLDIFESWNLTDAAKETGIFTSKLQAYGAESGKVAITIDFTRLDDATPNAGFLFLPQDRTEALLLEAARSTHRCRVLFGTTVCGFSQDADGVTIEVVSGGRPRRLRCQYLVACDGGHSAIRETLNLSLAGKTYQTRVLIADVSFLQRVSLPTPRIALKARGPLVLLRFDGSRCRVVGTVDRTEGDDAARSKEGVAKRIRMLVGDLPFELLWSSTFQIHSRVVQRLRVQRVFLAGDAAHLSSPAGGMGMNSGIEDAYNLGWKFAAVLGGAGESLLDSYEVERLYAIVHSVEQTSDIASNTLYFSPYAVRLLFMGLFRVAMKIRSVRRMILRTTSMLNTRYPASEFIHGDPRWAGRLAPDHNIQTRTGPGRLFEGRRGKPFVICKDVAVPVRADVRFEIVEISNADRAGFQRAWKVTGPFCAIVRPDGFVAWAKKNPSKEDIDAAIERSANWLSLKPVIR